MGFWDSTTATLPKKTPVSTPPVAKSVQPADNTFWGIAKNTVTGIPAAAKNYASGLLNADVGKAFGNENLNNTNAGIAANTILGLPKAAKEVLLPNRGYTDKQIAEASPSFWQSAQGIPKIAAEFSSSLGELPSLIPGYDAQAQKITNTPIGSKLADVGAAITDYGIPKNAQEANAMRFGDIAGFLPIGSAKAVNPLAEEVAALAKAGKIRDVVDPTVADVRKYKSEDGLVKGTNLPKAPTNPASQAIAKGLTEDEFVKEQIRDVGYQGGHQPNRNGVRAFDLTEKVDGEQMIPKDMYSRWYGSRGTPEDLQSIAVLKKIKGNPEADVTIYRAGPSKDFNDGDWVTLSKKYADQHAVSNVEAGKPMQVYSKVVKAKDVRWAMDDVNEFGYYPSNLKTTSELRAEYRAAKGATEPDVVKKALDANKQRLVDEGYVKPEASTAQKTVSEVDRLIAAGKIRVVRRGEYDVYQTKGPKGEWVNARDESSAVAKVTRASLPKLSKKESPAVEILKTKLEDKQFEVSFNEDVLSDHNGKQLLDLYKGKRYNNKFISYNDVGLDELVASRKIPGNEGIDTRIDEITGNTGADIDDAQKQLDDYLKIREQVKEARSEIVSIKKDLALTRKEESKPKAIGELTKKAPKPEPKVPELATKSMSEGEARSLEIVADQSLAKANQGARVPASSLESIVQDKPSTPVIKKVNILDYIRTPDRVLTKIGLGEEAKLVRTQYDGYLKELPQNIEKITQWSKEAGPGAGGRIFRYLDGEAIDLAPRERKVAGEIKEWLSEWADRLELPQDNRITHYITHIFDDQLIKKEFDEDLAKIIADKIPGSVYDPFLQKRLGAKGYKQDAWKALDAYTKRATRKVYMDPALEKLESVADKLEESQWNYVKRYTNGINMRPTELDNLIDNSIKSVVGYRLGGRPTAAITRTLRQVTYRAMLGLNPGSALRNLSQGINTYAKLGEKYTALGYVKLLSPSAREEIIREGVLNSNFIQDRSLTAAKKTLERIDKGLWVFFDGAEKINRGSAYLGAKAKALNMGKTEEQAIEYAKKIVRDTQFAFGSIDTPVILQSDIAKTLGQFQSFTTKQIEFLTEMAKNKEFAGLIRYALAGMAFVYTIGKAFGMKPEELIPLYRFGVPPSLKVPVEIGKAGLNVPNRYGQTPTTEQKLKTIGKAAFTGLVPAGTQMNKSLQGLGAIKQGASTNASGNVQFKVGGTPAKDAQALIFGKYANKEAQDYFDKAPTKEEKATQSVYDNVQKLVSEGKTEEATAIIEEMTDAEYEAYKKIRAAEKTKATKLGEVKLMPTVKKVQELVVAGRTDEAQAIVDQLSDEDYRLYTLAKKKLQ